MGEHRVKRPVAAVLNCMFHSPHPLPGYREMALGNGRLPLLRCWPGSTLAASLLIDLTIPFPEFYLSVVVWTCPKSINRPGLIVTGPWPNQELKDWFMRVVNRAATDRDLDPSGTPDTSPRRTLFHWINPLSL
jgi:hypothetical protein